MVRVLATALTLLVAATVAHGAAVPASVPAAARMAACPSNKVWRAPYGDAIKIPAAAVSDDQTWNGAWTKTYVPSMGMNTLIWGANNWNKGTIGAGQGVIQYSFEVPADGRYRWSAEIAAPHRTDWNDCWVSFPDGVFKQRFDGLTRAGSEWMKVYSNHGGDAFAWGGGTVDHDPHMLITPWLTKGEVVSFRISGRSNQIKIAYFGLHRCDTNDQGSPECANLSRISNAPTAQCG